MQLQYLFQKKYGDYCSPLEEDVNYSRFINTLKQKSKMIKANLTEQFFKKEDIALNGVISTRINLDKDNQFPLYLLGLDCDNVDNKNKATLELTSMGLNHVSIVSSVHPLHFWIIADYVSNLEECIFMMKQIPGIDEKYIYCCQKRQNIVFRAFPKENSGLPIFPLLDKACSKSFSDWYLDFWDYWISEDMKEIFANISSNKPLVSEKKLDIITQDNEYKSDFSNLDL